VQTLELRPFQLQALQALSRPGHLICVAPTGSGKSLIYEKLAKEEGFRTLLVSPLIALASQQNARLKSLGLRTCLGAGSFSTHGRTETPKPGSDVWIVSPEILTGDRSSLIRDWNPDFLVVDECHCLWEWGRDFRPAFQRLPDLLERHSFSRSLWLTATLPPRARTELRKRLPEPLHEIGEFRLPEALELRITRVPWPDRLAFFLRWLEFRSSAGIVFVCSRVECERLARALQAYGRRAIAYHAGLSQEERRAHERAIDQGVPEIVVATSAFGMGMHFEQLRWAVLWQAPWSLLSLAQAIGRVGRGDRGEALVLWDSEDFRLLEWSTRGSAERQRQLEETSEFLASKGDPGPILERYFRVN
jgi:ATP-dependent DNA helicase RecQ